jgi:two-component system chemotaxis response regulator CheY
MKILIVDDESVSCQIMQDILSACGICHVAKNGEEAVSAFEVARKEGEPYDILCLDIMMPGMDGHAVLKKIRALEAQNDLSPSKGVKIIMTTAMDNAKNVLGAFRSQCDAYILKPVDKDKLLKMVHSFGISQ